MPETSEVPQQPAERLTKKDKAARLNASGASLPSFPAPRELTPQDKRQEALADAVRLTGVRSELTAKHVLNVLASNAADRADKGEQK